MFTELENAKNVAERISDIDKEISIYKDLQIAACKARDNNLDRIYSKKVKELKAEKASLRDSIEYVRLKTFTKVVKSYMSKDLYQECWDKVDEVINNPHLMQ